MTTISTRVFNMVFSFTSYAGWTKVATSDMGGPMKSANPPNEY